MSAPTQEPAPDLPSSLHPALEPDLSETKGDTRGRLDYLVFGVSAALAIGFVLWGVLGTSSLSSASEEGKSWIITNTGWFFALISTGFVFLIIWLAASKYGNIPLGRDGEGPEFRTPSWIAMMFSAGMGIGLMFWGAAEPIYHFIGPPPGTDAEAGSPEAVKGAMATTMFHWGLHPWAIYAVAGLAIAYSVFRRGRALTISGVFQPLLGERAVNGVPGQIINIFAIFATLFGSATSLGLGALQIRSGLQIVGWLGDAGNNVLVLIIVVLTICFIVSAVSGVERGIQWLSNTNMVLALILALVVFVVGPTIFILNLMPTTLGVYLQNLLDYSSRTAAYGGGDPALGTAINSFLGGWTIFYWAWWVSWTPFVGMFIARISRGRTIRQFVTGVLLVPTTVSLVWFAIFGGAAIKTEEGSPGLISKAEGGPEAMLFSLLESMPWSTITSVLVMVLVAIFFVSGADAASIVMGAMSERGAIEPQRWNVIFWGVATGAAAAIMLLLGGKDALEGLQSVTIIAALPFLVVLLGMAVSLVKDLRTDPMVVRGFYARQAVETAVVEGVTEHGDDFHIHVEPTEPGTGVGYAVQSHGSESAAGADEEVRASDADSDQR